MKRVFEQLNGPSEGILWLFCRRFTHPTHRFMGCVAGLSILFVQCAVYNAARAQAPDRSGGGETQPEATPPVLPEPPLDTAADPSVEKSGEPPLTGPRRAPKAGDEVLIEFRNGDRIEGKYIRAEQGAYFVQVSAVEVRMPAADVERLTVLDTAMERYERMRKQIRDDDADRLVVLADWLQRRRMFPEARAELERALSVEPNHPEGNRLLAVVEQLEALDTRRGSGRDKEIERQREEANRFPERPKPSEFPLLNPDEINLLKVYEVDLRDPPSLTIPREVAERLLIEYSDHPLVPEERSAREALLRRPSSEILDLMFRLRARDFYGRVQVTDQPRSMRLFRDNVHAGWLVTSCASTACHGGSDSGRLQLFNYRPTAEASVYTNFLILDRFRTRQGEALIDYEEPERSLLLQMALPAPDVRTPHPQVPGWRPVFRNRESRRYVQSLEWIRSMYRPRPDYPIEYEAPGVKADPVRESLPAPLDPVER